MINYTIWSSTALGSIPICPPFRFDLPIFSQTTTVSSLILTSNYIRCHRPPDQHITTASNSPPRHCPSRIQRAHHKAHFTSTFSHHLDVCLLRAIAPSISCGAQPRLEPPTTPARPSPRGHQLHTRLRVFTQPPNRNILVMLPFQRQTWPHLLCLRSNCVRKDCRAVL